jgi:hypothetical protein
MVLSLAAALLLTADVHAGAEIGAGVGAPFKDWNAGFQFSGRGFLDIPLADKISVGGVLAVSAGFYNREVAFATASVTVADIMPGFRGRVAILDWIAAAVELGLGPAIVNTRVVANVFGIMSSQSDTKTYFAMRAALLVELAPPALSGLILFVEPAAVNGRLDQAFSEYRFTVGVGYRR